MIVTCRLYAAAAPMCAILCWKGAVVRSTAVVETCCFGMMCWLCTAYWTRADNSGTVGRIAVIAWVCPFHELFPTHAWQLRLQFEAEKQAINKQFDQRVAGMRLEKDQASGLPCIVQAAIARKRCDCCVQAKLEKAALKRLEKELSELKSLSASVLGPLARWQQRPGASQVGE